MKILLQLFFAFLKIGAFSFGGGYAAMPLIQAQVITRYGWLTGDMFADLVTIAEMTPGPIAVNAATFTGNLVAGVPGAICATIGVILPSCIFVTVLAHLYMKYRSLSLMQGVLGALRPAVVSMIFAAGLGIIIPAFFGDAVGIDIITGLSSLLAATNWRAVVLFALALFLLRVPKWNPILVMVLTGVLELVCQLAL